MGVFQEDKRLPFLPFLEHKGSGTTGMAPEIWTIFLNHFLRNNRTILHAEQPENGCKRSYKRELKSGIIQCYKTCRRVNAVIEYPGPAAGSRRINDTFETIYYIPCCEQ